MAVARMDGSVEVFHCSDRFFQEKIIPGREQCGIEGLSWVGERLFSAGLNGGITEYDLTNQKAKYTIDAYGGPIWAIAGNQQGTHLAVGCEDGTVKLFEVNEDSIQFERNLDRQKSRIVSLSWHPSGSKIAAGMMDMIQVFNIETGHSLHRMLADRGVGTSRSKECVVWSVVYLSDGTIITGDSVGMVKLWDDQTGTLIKSHNVTKCDVLALSVSQNEDSLVAGTSEGIVVQFQFVSMVLEKDDKEWVRTRTFRNHTHDIRAVAEITTAVVSGGMDAQLVVRPLLDKIEERSAASALRKIHFPHRRLVSCARKSGLMLFQYPGHLELWRLGESEGKGIPGSSLFVKRNPEKLLHLKVKGEDHIRCSAVSPCGEWIVYSTASTLRLYRLHCDNNNISITKISKLPKVLSSASQLCFSSDSSHLFSASAQSSVHLVSISQSGCKFVGTLKPKSDSHQAIHLLAASEDGKWVASANSDHEVHIYNLQTRKAHCTVPVYSSAVTAMGIHPATNCVFMMHADQQMFEYSIEQKQYTDWSRTVQRKGLHRLWVERDTPCLNVMFSPQNPSHVILHDMYMLCIIDQSLVRQTRIQKAFSLIFLILVDLCIYIYIYIYIYICLLFQLPAPIKQKKFAT
uniref:U3 small nucleolar RNA-associated protein 4 homolog n=1 Tax=Sinocyclocheilus grahami TaxID=75366 RepID=A0A672R6J7_SINGR